MRELLLYGGVGEGFDGLIKGIERLEEVVAAEMFRRKGREGGLHREFVRRAESVESGEGFGVGGDGLVRWPQRQREWRGLYEDERDNAGGRISRSAAFANFPHMLPQNASTFSRVMQQGSSLRRDASTGTRDARATRSFARAARMNSTLPEPPGHSRSPLQHPFAGLFFNRAWKW